MNCIKDNKNGASHIAVQIPEPIFVEIFSESLSSHPYCTHFSLSVQDITTTHYPLRKNPEERSNDYATTQHQHSTGPLEMSANGRDPEPFTSGEKQLNPWYFPLFPYILTSF
jgi:hypothetical protein